MAIIRTADRPLNELFGGSNWSADIDVICNGGASSVSFFDQLSAVTQAAGTFRLYGGIRGTLLGPWTTVTEIDRTSARITVMYPGPLSSSGASFSTYPHAAP